MKHLLTITFNFLFFFSFGQFYPVFIDGNTNEWNQSVSVFTDEAGDGNSIDLIKLSGLNDSENLYIYIRIFETINLNSHNTLKLLIDTDNNSETGYQKNGIGAELKWSFSQRKGVVYFDNNEITVWHNDIGFVALPTVTGSEFEIAINRKAVVNGNPLFPSDKIALSFYADETNGDMIPESGSKAIFTFDDSDSFTFSELSLEKTQTGFLRLMTFNTLYDGIIDPDKQPSFKRIIQAVNPDILTLNECWDTEPSQIKALLNVWLPVTGGEWFASKLMDGNITASKFPILNNYNVLPGQRLAASLIDLPDALFPTDIVVVNCHLKCCNDEGDNDTRQYEVDGLIHFISKMKNGLPDFEVEKNTPFAFMGDFNLVGDNQQLQTLITGDIQNTDYFGIGGLPDWNNQPMGNIVSTGSNNNMAYTWRDNEGSYWPGRLDYIFYTQSGLKKEKSFILETSRMTDQALETSNLKSTDSQTASDHFPHVADFSVHAYNHVTSKISDNSSIFPNPTDGRFIFMCPAPVHIENILLFHATGTVVENFTAKSLNEYQVEISGLSKGFYVLKAVTMQKTYIETLIVQ